MDALRSFRKQHPRRFLAVLVGGFCMLCITLAGQNDVHGKVGESYRSYAYPPAVHGADIDKASSWPALGPADLAAAVRRSEELWQRSVNKRKQFVVEQGGWNKMKMWSDKWHVQMWTLWDVFLPAFPCPWEVERVGRMGDGGKFTCGLPRIREKRGKKCVVYSFGVERESSWEAEILERSDCEIYMYDFSVSTFGPQLQAMDPAMSSRAHFFPYGIADVDGMIDGHQFYRLETLMQMNGHDWIDILKVDVEGAEFKMFSDVVKHYGNGNLPFSQLLIELHAERTEHSYATHEFGAWWKMLEDAGLRGSWAEINYACPHPLVAAPHSHGNPLAQQLQRPSQLRYPPPRPVRMRSQSRGGERSERYRYAAGCSMKDTHGMYCQAQRWHSLHRAVHPKAMHPASITHHVDAFEHRCPPAAHR